MKLNERYLLNSFKVIEMFCLWNKAPYNFLKSAISRIWTCF